MKGGVKESKSKKKKFWGIFRGLLRKERDKLPASPNGYIQLEDPDEKKKEYFTTHCEARRLSLNGRYIHNFFFVLFSVFLQQKKKKQKIFIYKYLFKKLPLLLSLLHDVQRYVELKGKNSISDERKENLRPKNRGLFIAIETEASRRVISLFSSSFLAL